LGETTNIIENIPEIAKELEQKLNKFLKPKQECGNRKIRDIEGTTTV